MSFRKEKRQEGKKEGEKKMAWMAQYLSFYVEGGGREKKKKKKKQKEGGEKASPKHSFDCKTKGGKL